MRAAIVLACGLGVASASSSSVIGWSTVPGTFRTNTALAGGVTVQKPDLFSAVGLPTYGASVVFVQDGVELDDLARFGGIYGEDTCSLTHIKGAVESSASSTFLPSVQGLGHDAIVKAMGASGAPVVQVDASDFASQGITVSANNNTAIVVTLPSVAGAADMAAALAKNDALIGEIVSTLSSNGAPLCVMVVSSGDRFHGAATSLRNRRSSTASGSGVSAFQSHQCKSAACRYARNVGAPSKIMFFSTTILQGLVVCGLMVVIFLIGTFGLMVLATNDGKFPDPTDDDLIVSTRNE
eukprot:m.162701 g.162701  ORF g.162701 m.162701 type:complete len:296 (-) comp12229_c0_seq1:200-1087(-)